MTHEEESQILNNFMISQEFTDDDLITTTKIAIKILIYRKVKYYILYYSRRPLQGLRALIQKGFKS